MDKMNKRPEYFIDDRGLRPAKEMEAEAAKVDPKVRKEMARKMREAAMKYLK